MRLPVRALARPFVLLSLVLAFVVTARAEDAGAIVILANRDDPESLELARHYAAKRGLPERDIVALPMPLTEQITWEEFVVTVWNPLLREAVRREWLFASISDEKDAVGRLRTVVVRHRLRALVVCRGVPLRVAHDPARYDPATNPLTGNAVLRSNEGAVDSELSLLAAGDYPIAAFVPNPLFSAERPSSHALDQILPVGRLDGPTLADAKGLVDRAVEAERFGLAGRAYVDIGGPHRRGDDWLEECVSELRSLGFDTDADRERPTLPGHARFDAPALYFGWYAGDLNGPFAAPGFRFPVGAVALHIHSFSAHTLRSPQRGWVGPLVARGVTATLGNVSEPYLEFTHQPHLLLRALARGETIGRAALYSVNALSWRAILVGDPLYRPFALTAEEQWAAREKLPPELEPYARLRRMRLLAAAGRGEEALALGRAGLRQNPSLPFALGLAGVQLSADDAASARRTLGIFSALKTWRPADRPLALAAARAFQAAGSPKDGLALMERLLAASDLPKEQRVFLLGHAVAIARSTPDPVRAADWEAERARLTAPPPAPPAAPAKP